MAYDDAAAKLNNSHGGNVQLHVSPCRPHITKAEINKSQTGELDEPTQFSDLITEYNVGSSMRTLET
jgi:hypothetical protein